MCFALTGALAITIRHSTCMFTALSLSHIQYTHMEESMTADNSCCSIIIFSLPWLPLPWQPVHDVQPFRGRARKNGSTHSYAGAFLRRGVPIMAASSPSSSLLPILLFSSPLVLLHLWNEGPSPFPEILDGCWLEACSLLQLCLACRRREEK